MKNLAIIPARGGSKRIPRKNIKDFLGKPIIAYSIDAALQTGLFNDIVVSTDDEEIAKIAIKHGAQVPFMRSESTSSDFSTTLDALKEVETELRQQGKIYDYICCIYATAPLIQKDHLINGFNLLTAEHLTSVHPVVAFSYPIWRGLRINSEGKSEMIWKEYADFRSQDLEAVYHDAGQWYWYNPSKISDSLFTDNSSAIILSEEYVQDIDTLTDWTLAELKYEFIQNSK